MSTNSQCPFHVSVEDSGAIVNIALNRNPRKRIKVIQKAFEFFYSNKKMAALSFSLPESITEKFFINDLELQIALYEYQSEVIAADIDYRLGMFLPYATTRVPETWEQGDLLRHIHSIIAENLFKQMQLVGVHCSSVSDIAVWTRRWLITQTKSNHGELPVLDCRMDNAPLFFVSSGSFGIYAEENEQITGKDNNDRNCFGFPTTPFYHESFARYSDEIKLVLTRRKLINSISENQAQTIRRNINDNHIAHGVEMNRDDTIPDGLWIPRYEH